jgi:hypothetical protein
MDIVNITIKLGIGSRRREGGPSAKGLAPAPYAELRAPMIFLIANMGYKISPNSLKTRDKIFSSRKVFGASLTSAEALESRKTEPLGPRECAKIMGSTKGEFALV